MPSLDWLISKKVARGTRTGVRTGAWRCRWAFGCALLDGHELLLDSFTYCQWRAIVSHLHQYTLG